VFSSRERDDNSIQVLTANIQLGQGRIYSLLREIRRMKPDVILLQEVSPDVVPILNKGLAEWTGEISGGHWIGARGTVTILGGFDAPSTRRRAAAAARVQCEKGSLVVASIHLTTARWGLEGLSWKSPFTLEGVKAFEDHERLRTAESRETREWLNSLIGDQPSIVGGDFNSPPHVPQFRRVWGAFQDAFVSGGVGYGYTARCDHPPYWLENTPWIRIDYLLYTHHFRCPSAWTGHTDGSDHRIVAARFLRIR
jgi:endonuclease/exonuclease/phosphatase family metal-dependent hydrolase